VASCNDITKKFFEAKRLTFPEPHKPVTAKKICVWQRSNKNSFPQEITHVRDDECQREATGIKQSVTVHEKSTKAEPSTFLHIERSIIHYLQKHLSAFCAMTPSLSTAQSLYRNVILFLLLTL